MKISKAIPFAAGPALACLLAFLFLGCNTAPESRPTPPAVAAEVQKEALPPSIESWECRNDLEVSCSQGKCSAETEGGFTPMSVSASGSGALSVCAYSGCWEGKAKVHQDETFLILVGHALPFSTAPDDKSANADVALVVDRGEGVATLKVGAFALPLLCQESSGTTSN